MLISQPDLALATIPVPRGLTARLGNGNTTLGARWIWFLASLLTLLLFLTVFWSARLGESDPLPAAKAGKAAPGVPNPPSPASEPPGLSPPPPPEPGIVLPTDPPIVIPPADAIRLERVVWNRNGTVTIHWGSVPGAVKYRLEAANEDSSKVRFLGESDQPFYTFSSQDSGHVRIIAILRGGQKVASRWFQIPREQLPNK